MLTKAHPRIGEDCVVPVGPARQAVVSWNSRETNGTLELRVDAADGRTSAWLPYAAYYGDRRASLGGRDEFARVEIDIVKSEVDIAAIGVRSKSELDAIFISTPEFARAQDVAAKRDGAALVPVDLAVPAISQYVDAYPSEPHWCAPASMAMLLGYQGHTVNVPVAVREVYDTKIGGGGNWAFNAAFAGRLGLRSAVIHMRDLAHAHTFLANDLPLALTVKWEPGDLTGAPLSRTNGHIVVLRGIDANGDAIVNDPAHPNLTITYPRAEFERAWLGHSGVAIVVAPEALGDTLVHLANA